MNPAIDYQTAMFVGSSYDTLYIEIIRSLQKLWLSTVGISCLSRSFPGCWAGSQILAPEDATKIVVVNGGHFLFKPQFPGCWAGSQILAPEDAGEVALPHPVVSLGKRGSW